MLDELRIRRLGVIDDAVLPLGPGLTVVSGETGAGKTMVVTGLLLLFGGRADTARIRVGAHQATVDGRLLLPPDSAVADRVRAAGGELDVVPDGRAELVLQRIVNASGRSRAHVGGATTPVAVLAELAESLLAVHGQSEQLRLARPAAQLAALDDYAGLDHRDLAGYRAAFETWRSATAALEDRVGRSAQLRREADLLTRGLREIEAVDPQADEAAELGRVASRLAHADALSTVSRLAHDALLGSADDPVGAGEDVVALVAGAARAASHQRFADAELDALAARLEELQLLAADLGSDFAAYADGLDADPGQLERVESRRAQLVSLVRSYCDEPEPSIAGVLRWAEAARARLADIDVSDDAIAALRRAAADAAAGAATHAADLATRRRVAAQDLGSAVTAELHGLAMPDARLTVSVATRPAAAGSPALPVHGRDAGATSTGCDEVSFLLQAHSGAPALPLGRGASGGELSRVMLALEVSLAAPRTAGNGTSDRIAQPIPTLVFDEVDAGVGGRAALEVGRRLARLAQDRQVLVVTHLAQVAACADQHVVVDKSTRSRSGAGPVDDADISAGVVASDVRVVHGADRLAELARMLSGSDSPTARRHAAELLADARRPPGTDVEVGTGVEEDPERSLAR